MAQVDTASDDGLIGGLLPWIRSFTSSVVNAPVVVDVDGDAIDRVIEQWEREAIRVPAFDGDIRIVGRTVEIDYPRAGLRIDREAAHSVVESALLAGRHGPEEIPLLDLPPPLSTEDLDEAAATIDRLISQPVTLRNAVHDATLVVTPAEIAEAVTIDFVLESPARIDIGLDPVIIGTAIEPRAAELGTPPIEVQIDTNVAAGSVTVTPPENGSRVDLRGFAKGWAVDDGTTSSETATLAAFIETWPAGTWIDLMMAKRITKEDAIERGKDMAADVAALIDKLFPLYEASVSPPS